jgi:hypothetical protein
MCYQGPDVTLLFWLRLEETTQLRKRFESKLVKEMFLSFWKKVHSNTIFLRRVSPVSSKNIGFSKTAPAENSPVLYVCGLFLPRAQIRKWETADSVATTLQLAWYLRPRFFKSRSTVVC